MGHFFLKTLKSKRGQTFLEYIMLLSVAFIAAYIMITGPLADFTTKMLNGVHEGLGNTVKHGEWTADEINPGDTNHPASPSRLRPLHL